LPSKVKTAKALWGRTQQKQTFGGGRGETRKKERKKDEERRHCHLQ
jgi:hypothetical protein